MCLCYAFIYNIFMSQQKRWRPEIIVYIELLYINIVYINKREIDSKGLEYIASVKYLVIYILMS